MIINKTTFFSATCDFYTSPENVSIVSNRRFYFHQVFAVEEVVDLGFFPI